MCHLLERGKESDRGVVRGRQWNRLKDWGRVSKEITDNNEWLLLIFEDYANILNDFVVTSALLKPCRAFLFFFLFACVR